MLETSLPVHPSTGQRAVYRSPKTGRLFWPVKGGSGEGGDPAGPPRPPSGDPNPAPPAPPAADPAAEQQLADAIARAEQAAAERDELRAALDAVTRALNPNGGEVEQDPAALTAAVAERDRLLTENATALRGARVELAVARAAADQGARGDRLLNSRSFLTSVADLDPADAGFDDALTTAIKVAVDADPDLYRTGPAGPPRGGAEFHGAPADERRPASLHDAVAARMSGA
ncbi:hypothetical protein [Streptomyces sp. NPDC097981]|uniref:hypothetical protein n=1 Tax=Streptomyces sp. NPDC097981 TaxID=3155428 RepID=UPI00332B28C6